MMKTSEWYCSVLLGLAALLLSGQPVPGGEAKTYPGFGQIERADPRFDALVPPGAVLERLAEGFEWSEGPVWIREGGHLLFSDIPRNSVMKWKEGEGISLFMKPSGYTGVVDYSPEPGSNGLNVDPQGRVVFCEHGD